MVTSRYYRPFRTEVKNGARQSCIYRHPVAVSLAARRCRTAATCLPVLDTMLPVPATHRRLIAASQCICVCTSILTINIISFSTELVIASSQYFAALLFRFQFWCDMTPRHCKQNLSLSIGDILEWVHTCNVTAFRNTVS